MEALKKQEQQWQAEEDARIMARYQEIVNDSARKSRAVKEANKQAADLLKRANAAHPDFSVATHTAHA